MIAVLCFPRTKAPLGSSEEKESRVQEEILDEQSKSLTMRARNLLDFLKSNFLNSVTECLFLQGPMEIGCRKCN